MSRRKLTVTVAVVLAAVAAATTVSYAAGADRRALAGQEAAEVWVVTATIERGTPAAAITGRVERVLIPALIRPEDAVSDLASLTGLVAAVDLVAGEQLLTSRFTPAAELDPQKVTLVPAGMQELSFLLPMDRVVGGRIRPGDRVGVIVTLDAPLPGAERTEDNVESGDESPESVGLITRFLLQEVLVTFVHVSTALADTPPPSSATQQLPAGSMLVTVAVDTNTAERLVLALETGSVRLTLLNPETVQSGSSPVFKGNIFD
jgi:pilus assembly protein CpaB